MQATRRLYKNILIALVSMVAVLGLTIVSAQAQEDTSAQTANTIKVSPLRTDVTADPGETKVVKVTVSNPTSVDVSVRPIQNDFTSDDEEGNAAIILDENEYAPSHSLKRFMQPLENVIIKAGGSETVEVTLAVPANAEPGGYFGAVRFAPTTPDSGGQVNMSASVASLILLRVNGDAPEKLSLTDFMVQQSKKTGAFFMDGSNLSVFARFHNEGNVQAGPFGKVSVLKGDQLVYDTDFNQGELTEVVLPDSARRWNIPLNDIEGFGKYTVSATFTYGANNQTIEATNTFWIIPLWMIIGGIVLVLAVIGLIIWLIAKRRGSSNMSLGR